MSKENTEQFELVVSCAVGLEQLVAEELCENGGKNINQMVGAVSASGDLECAYRLCLWSRFASRVFLQLASFSIRDEDELYLNASRIPWQKHLGNENTFAVNASLRGKTRVSNSQFAALRVKDALVDYFRQQSGERPSVQAQRPDTQFHLHLEKGEGGDNATIFIDLSGEGLHRRGYRVSGTLAPLKENLAAAIVGLSGWRRGEALLDPMCGSGTLLIEAAMIFGDVAPGISRPYFGFLGWRGHDEKLWECLVREAAERRGVALQKKWPLFLGYDADPVAVSAARKNITRAGLDEYVQVKQADLATFASPCETGTIVSNLPFGERLEEEQTVSMLYRAVGRITKERFPHWKLAVFISRPELTDRFSLKWERRERLFHGGLPCRLLCTALEGQQESSFVWDLPEQPQLPDTGLDFANRLRKNFQKMQKWAKKEGISCYRIYDRDLPEYNFSLDLYEKWFHLQEYAPPGTVGAEVAEQRIKTAIQVIQTIFAVRSNRLFVKRRERQRGSRQYEKKKNTGKMVEVREGEAALLVNFTDYLDVGLFLDHRPLRSRIFQQAKGRRFLNLFAYTGTATVQAALGGAVETTTVDLSANYLDWARKNIVLNGFSQLRHHFIKADSMEWLRQAQGRFDCIFVDPPTFSNTKKEKRVFDIQRDHVELLTLAMRRLSEDGVLWFSTNFRRFQLDESLLSQYDIDDISLSTIPHDFHRNRNIHRCWELRRVKKTGKE